MTEFSRAKSIKHAGWLAALLAGLLAGSNASATEVVLCTDRGRVVIELADEQAPRHVANFLRYVDMGYYTGTVFHRAVAHTVVQAGGVDRDLRERPVLAPVENEATNALRNVRGAVAAARGDDPDSATSQFLVNLKDNPELDPGDDAGYSVFGHVTEGLELLDEISALPTGAAAPFEADVPTPLVAIRSIARRDEAALAALPIDDPAAALRHEIEAAAAARQHADVLRAVEHYRSLCAAPAPEVALLEAESAAALGDGTRARYVLEELFATTAASHPSYAAAVALQHEISAEGAEPPAQRVGDCAAPVAPAVPDGTAAPLEELVEAQTDIREFVAAAEAYLACLARIIDDTNRPAVERNAAIVEHNRMVATMEKTANDFNEQIRKFRARGA